MTGIHPDLQPLAFPVEQLDTLPGNPRRGDVAAVARSYAAFGQRKPIVCRRQGDSGIVLAGNHQLLAARQLGWEEIAVVWVDDDDLTAKAFAIADNRTSDLGEWDQDLLAEMLSDVSAEDDLLAAAGYTAGELEKLLGNHDGPGAPDQTDELTNNWQVVVTCRDEGHQLELLRRLSEEGLECRALTS